MYRDDIFTNNDGENCQSEIGTACFFDHYAQLIKVKENLHLNFVIRNKINNGDNNLPG